MKLRNKSTGEIWDIGKIITNEYHSYDTLESIYEDFEDLDKPLIESKKFRNVVRLWAELNELSSVLYSKDKDCIYSSYGSFNSDTKVFISFYSFRVFEKLEDGKEYTIEELCRSEE